MSKLKSLFHHITWLAKGVKVFALIGKAGTGKSFRANLIAQKYGIEMIIDDGLIIRDQKILAGKSAKKERGSFSAMKTALFFETRHFNDVQKVLKRQHFKRILIIGISERMVKKIAKRLDLPSISKIIKIEEIATEEEIEKAIHSREIEGKHIIPVLAIEVKRDYPNIFLQSIKVLFKNKFFIFKRKENVFEKAVVRAEYDKKGHVSISESALSQMILHCVDEFNPEVKVEKLSLKKDRHDNYMLKLFLSVPFGIALADTTHTLRNYVNTNITKFTGIFLKEVNITIINVKEKNA